MPSAKHGPFAEVYPELSDFNVFDPFSKSRIGNQLLEEAENESALFRVRSLLLWFALRHMVCPEIVHQTGLHSRWDRCSENKPLEMGAKLSN